MSVTDLNEGDVVYAAVDIANDGSLPGVAEDAPLATAGTRGVLIRHGHLEEVPQRRVFLVRFEDVAGQLGPPVGCWEDELSCTAE